MGENVYVKIPITNTARQPPREQIRRLVHSGVKVNVTGDPGVGTGARRAEALARGAPSVVSVFAGRMADTGVDPALIMAEAVRLISPHPGIELWASPRELLNTFQANDVGCHIITATDSVLSKLKVVGKELCDYSLGTVRMFYNDAAHSGYQL